MFYDSEPLAVAYCVLANGHFVSVDILSPWTFCLFGHFVSVDISVHGLFGTGLFGTRIFLFHGRIGMGTFIFWHMDISAQVVKRISQNVHIALQGAKISTCQNVQVSKYPVTKCSWCQKVLAAKCPCGKKSLR